MSFLPKWVKRLMSNDVDNALAELRAQLKAKGYNTEYLPDETNPDYRMGMRIWVVIADLRNGDGKSPEELRKKIERKWSPAPKARVLA